MLSMIFAGAALGSSTSTNPADAVAQTTAPLTADTLAPIDLPTGPIDEPSLNQLLKHRGDALGTAFTDRSDAATFVRGAVASAEFALARQIEPPLSRALLGIAGPDDATTISRSARQARQWLQRAEEKLPAVAKGEERDALEDRIEANGAYAALFAALAESIQHRATGLSPPPTSSHAKSDDAANHLLAACRRLAAMLDASDPEAAAAARLWQGVAYRRAGRTDRAMQILPIGSALKPLPFALFSAMERCRTLADRGEHAAALAVAATLNNRIDAAISSPRQSAAHCAMMMLREQIWRDWAVVLASNGNARDVANARREADELKQARLKLRTGAYRLGVAFGGVRIPLEDARKPPQIFDIACEEPTIAIVLDPAHIGNHEWREMQDAVARFVKDLRPDQKIALLATTTADLRIYPDLSFAATQTGKPTLPAEFIRGTRPHDARPGKLSEGLRRAIDGKPNTLIVITTRWVEDAAGEELAALAKENRTKVHVILCGGRAKQDSIRRFVHAAGGSFRAVGKSTATAPAEIEPGDDPVP